MLAFFDEDRPEPFFVKNLERVQGDERDDVILTVGYGKTPHGRVLHRFGPLNIEGGERRLNVAITRARRSMTVVSSIAAADLDPARLRARGAMMLRDFLAYAAGGPLPGRGAAPAADAGCPPRPRMAGVPDRAARRRDPLGGAGRPRAAAAHARARRARGRRVLGRPGRPRRRGPGATAAGLLLAVESDGPQYAAMRTTRDRDRLRAEQLERLGWRHLRVWSTDVFRDPARDVVAHPRGRRECGEAPVTTDRAGRRRADRPAASGPAEPAGAGEQAPAEPPSAAGVGRRAERPGTNPSAEDVAGRRAAA